MPDKKSSTKFSQPKTSKGIFIILGIYFILLLLVVLLSALSLKLFAPEPTIAPEVLEQSVGSTLEIALPIYVDGTIRAMVPGAISGTLTAIVPTQTPTPTLPPIPCDLAGFVSDVTIPDGFRLNASQAFTKVWLIRNLGSCTWNADYSLVYKNGELMAGQSPITIGKTLEPGEMLELSLNLVAPASSGIYTSNWVIQNSDGNEFGLSPDGQPLSLLIAVGSIETIALDFTEKACSASWTSSVGPIECPNPEQTISGSVNPVDTSIIEYGQQINVPAIEVIPDDGSEGVITGTFELMQIQKSDTFYTIVGCGDGQPECNIIFELKYDAGDHNLISLGRWTEKTDGALQKVTVDLSSLEGKTIRLILIVSSINGAPRENKGIWISPVVLRRLQ